MTTDVLRIGTVVFEGEGYADELLSLLRDCPGLFAELAFFTSNVHSPMPLDRLREVADKLAPVLTRFRAEGWRVGINHLTTIGHHEENLEDAVDPALRRQVGFDGQVCRGALCPADPEVLEYVRDSYRVLTAAGPDFLWIDDDVRLNQHMPSEKFCVCDGCLRDLSGRLGETLSRESFLAVFHSDDDEKRQTIRDVFFRRNREVIGNLLAEIELAVHETNPAVELGFMSTQDFWAGFGFADWAAALRGKTKLPVRWRPGEGFYSDRVPQDMLDKVNSVGRQVAPLPPYVSSIQTEVENFPYGPLDKSVRFNALEMTAYLFAGCTGNAWNVLGTDPVAVHRPRIEELAGWQPFWTRLKEELRGTHLTGAWPGWDPMQLAAGAAGECWEIQDDMNRPYALQGLGIPVCYRREDAAFAALSGRMPHALGTERMRELLAGGVLLDTVALQSVHELGLGELTGVALGAAHTKDTQEQLTDHPFNAGHAGQLRDWRQSFLWWHETACTLEPATADVEVLSRLVDYRLRDRGAGATCTTNALGGRVAVLSYYPWRATDIAGRARMLALSDWLAGGRMPVVLETPARVVLWVRRGDHGRWVLGVLNFSADVKHALELTLNGVFATCRELHPDGGEDLLEMKQDGSATRIVLCNVEAFSFRVIVLDPVKKQQSV